MSFYLRAREDIGAAENGDTRMRGTEWTPPLRIFKVIFGNKLRDVLQHQGGLVLKAAPPMKPPGDSSLHLGASPGHADQRWPGAHWPGAHCTAAGAFGWAGLGLSAAPACWANRDTRRLTHFHRRGAFLAFCSCDSTQATSPAVMKTGLSISFARKEIKTLGTITLPTVDC